MVHFVFCTDLCNRNSERRSSYLSSNAILHRVERLLQYFLIMSRMMPCVIQWKEVILFPAKVQVWIQTSIELEFNIVDEFYLCTEAASSCAGTECRFPEQDVRRQINSVGVSDLFGDMCCERASSNGYFASASENTSHGNSSHGER